jgi:hypothetical protein
VRLLARRLLSAAGSRDDAHQSTSAVANGNSDAQAVAGLGEPGGAGAALGDGSRV